MSLSSFCQHLFTNAPLVIFEVVNLQHLIPIVIDDLDGYLARGGRVERNALGSVE